MIVRLICALFSLTALSRAEDVFSQFALRRIAGSGTETVSGLAADASGNLLVSGVTTSPDLPVRGAAQPSLGESTILRTIDGGKTWQKLALPPVDLVNTLEPHPSNPAILLAGTARGIYKTADAGQSWQATFSFPVTPVPVAGRSVSRIAYDPAQPAFVYALTTEGVIRSGDGGDTWARVESGLGGVSSFSPILAVDPHGSGMVVAGSLFGLMQSRDHGSTWTPLRIPPPGILPTMFAFDPRRASRYYLAQGPGSIGPLYISEDRGETWTSQPLPGNSLVTGITFGGKQGSIFAVTLTGAYRSDDDGLSWVALPATPAASIYYGSRLAVLPAACPAPLLAGAGGRLVTSSDDGRTWTTGPFSDVADLVAGPNCAVYAARRISGDAFVAKLTPGGDVLWFTYAGGSGRESVSSTLTDPLGNIYVSGSTDSPDFPGGASTQPSTFVLKFTSEGALAYSRLLPATNPISLAVGARGDAFLLTVPRPDFGAEPGATYEAIHLSPTGDIAWRTAFTEPPLAITADSQGAVTITTGRAIVRLDAAGKELRRETATPYANASILATDAEDNTYFIGATTDAAFPVTIPAEGRSHACPFYSTNIARSIPPGDPYVVKRAPDGAILYATLLAGECPAAVGSAAVSPSGVVLSLATQSTGFPLHYPIGTAGLNGTGQHAVIAALDAGGALAFATYTPAFTNGPVAATNYGIHAAFENVLMRIPMPDAAPIALHAVNNAFSQASNGIAAGSLIALTGDNLGPEEPLDQGLDAASLPVTLGGTQALLDGVPMQVLRVSSSLVIAVAPPPLPDATTALFEIVRDGQRSNAVTVRLRPSVPQILAADFPQVDRYLAAPDGAVRNSDGTPNAPSNPAPRGSTVRFMLTGTTDNILYSSLDNFAAPIAAQPVPGLIEAIRQVAVRIPTNLDANRITVSISPNPAVRSFSPVLASRPVTVYVQ